MFASTQIKPQIRMVGRLPKMLLNGTIIKLAYPRAMAAAPNSMLTSGRVLWNVWMKIGVSGGIANGVSTLIKTKIA